MSPSILPVSPTELPQCADVIRRAFQTVADEFGLTVENCPTNGAFIRTERLAADRDGGAFQYGLYENGVLWGYMELKRKTDALFTLEKLAVPPEHRHKGYGALLLEHARTEAARMGGAVISIGIIEENARLREWYLRHSFVHTGVKKFEHLPFTVGFMELRLAQGK